MTKFYRYNINYYEDDELVKTCGIAASDGFGHALDSIIAEYTGTSDDTDCIIESVNIAPLSPDCSGVFDLHGGEEILAKLADSVIW